MRKSVLILLCLSFAVSLCACKPGGEIGYAPLGKALTIEPYGSLKLTSAAVHDGQVTLCFDTKSFGDGFDRFDVIALEREEYPTHTVRCDTAATIDANLGVVFETTGDTATLVFTDPAFVGNGFDDRSLSNYSLTLTRYLEDGTQKTYRFMLQ